MELAYILINCDLGKEGYLIDSMKKKFKKNIREVTEVYGVYDIVAEVYVKDTQNLKDIIEGFRKIPEIKSTISMFVTDG